MIRQPESVDVAIEDHAAFIARDSPNAARRFVTSVTETLRGLEGAPPLGRVWSVPGPWATDVRVWRVRGFPSHLIFYREIEGGIEVLDVRHAKQDLHALFDDEPG